MKPQAQNQFAPSLYFLRQMDVTLHIIWVALETFRNPSGHGGYNSGFRHPITRREKKQKKTG